MPKVTIYIREGDYEVWQKIEDKPKFIHGALTIAFDKEWQRKVQEGMLMAVRPKEIGKIYDASKCSHMLTDGKCTKRTCPDYKK